jgi:predicted HicB family RNase H-like nuclease
MINVLEINGNKAIITYDPEIEMFRGEFLLANGGADFYAKDIKGLKKEAKLSLKVFNEVCNERGIKPKKLFSGKFNVRIDPELHEKAVIAAAAKNKSLNQLVADAIEDVID